MSARRRRDALEPDFFARPAATVGRELLGMILVSTIGGRRTAGRIVEAEAYIGPHDEASHAAARIGRTARNEVMFGPPGRAYVYRIYGIHWSVNAVTDREDYPAGVLLRALEPVAGLSTMRRRRGLHAGTSDRMLASGPGKLAAALGITSDHNGQPLDRAPLWIEQGESVPDGDVIVGPRIGITRAADWPLRFHVRGSPWISRR